MDIWVYIERKEEKSIAHRIAGIGNSGLVIKNSNLSCLSSDCFVSLQD